MRHDRPHAVCMLGCGGFVGSHLLSRLLDEGSFKVVGIDIDASKIRSLLDHPRLTFLHLDLHDTERVRQLVEQSDTVISLAALCNPSLYNTIPLDVIEINFMGPLEVVKMCAELNKWLIHFSTSEVYGKTVGAYTPGIAYDDEAVMLNEDTTPLIMGPVSAQRWSYAAAKQLLERTIYAYGFEKGLDYTTIRPFNFFGPRMDFIPGIDGEGIPRVLACFMEALMKHKPLQLVDGGKNHRTFTYIDDAVDAMMAILANREKAAGQIFNIGNPDNGVTIAELADLMISVYTELHPESAERGIEKENISARDFYGEGYDDSDRRVPDITKARKLLGWNPRTRLVDGLRKTIAYYVEEYQALCSHREIG